jgi:predicted TIM-barrel fold metal-dependent hydrolase
MAHDRYVIVSSDAHAGAPLRGYRDYLDPAWRNDFDEWVAAVVNPWHDVNDARNWDSDARLAAMDAEGISAEVLFPNTLPPFYDIQTHLGGVPRDQAEFERRWAGLRAHNRWLVEFCAAAPQRRRGLIQLLPNDVEAAVAEMRWAAAHPVVGGVMLPAVPPNHVLPPYFHDRYEPIWHAAVELGLPIHQHQGSGSPDAGSDQPVARSIFYVDLELWTRLTMSHLIVGGVFERHPQLRVVWTEMPGLRWVVEDLERITRQLGVVQSRWASDPAQLNYHHTFGSPEVEGLRLSPLEYFRRNCYLGASMVSAYDMPYVDVLGVDRIMWGHDGPHEEGSGGRATEALRVLLADRSVDDATQMLTTTAAQLYGFDLDALGPVAARIGPRVAEVHTPMAEVPLARGSAFWRPNELRVALEAGGVTSGL